MRDLSIWSTAPDPGLAQEAKVGRPASWRKRAENPAIN